MSDDELTPTSVGHLRAIQRASHLYKNEDKIDAIVEAILDLEDQIIKLVRKVNR